nr:MAG TPA: hypothetical protein [Caudoviricetes sp.]
MIMFCGFVKNTIFVIKIRHDRAYSYYLFLQM